MNNTALQKLEELQDRYRQRGKEFVLAKGGETMRNSDDIAKRADGSTIEPADVRKVDRDQDAEAMIKNIIGGRRHARSAEELAGIGVERGLR